MTAAPLPTMPEAGRQERWARLLADHPLYVLGGVLVVLILVTGAIQPNYLSVSGLRNTVLLAAPLGIMAAGQTILMLTGGIDLSVAMIATGAAYVAGNRSPSGAAFAIAFGLVVGLLAGAANGIGVGVFQVNPLIMTLAMSAILLGLFTRGQTIFTGSTTGRSLHQETGGVRSSASIPYTPWFWPWCAVLVMWMLNGPSGAAHLRRRDNRRPPALGRGIWQVPPRLLYTTSRVLLFAALAGIILAPVAREGHLQLATALLLPSVAAR